MLSAKLLLKTKTDDFPNKKSSEFKAIAKGIETFIDNKLLEQFHSIHAPVIIKFIISYFNDDDKCTIIEKFITDECKINIRPIIKSKSLIPLYFEYVLETVLNRYKNKGREISEITYIGYSFKMKDFIKM